MKIEVPAPVMTDEAKLNFATECAFTALVINAKHPGLPLKSVLGLMYLPSQDLTRQFQEVCRAIIASLEPKEPNGQ